MPFHLKRTNVLDPNKTVYYTAYRGLGWEQFALDGDPFESIAW